MQTQPASPSRYTETLVPFLAGDGRSLNLHHVRGAQEPTKGPVLLVHGAGVRANIFRAPVATDARGCARRRTATTCGWRTGARASTCRRASGRSTRPPSTTTRRPSQTIVRETGRDEVKAIVHCQGSTSFMMSAVAGLAARR